MQRKEIERLKGKITKMQEMIKKLEKRKRELKEMLPSGSGEQGTTYCSCKKKNNRNSEQYLHYKQILLYKSQWYTEW